MHLPNRVDCGYPGIKALECAGKGCCWDSSINGVYWCFYPAGIRFNKNTDDYNYFSKLGAVGRDSQIQEL